jgi:hypothetical protein
MAKFLEEACDGTPLFLWNAAQALLSQSQASASM